MHVYGPPPWPRRHINSNIKIIGLLELWQLISRSYPRQFIGLSVPTDFQQLPYRSIGSDGTQKNFSLQETKLKNNFVQGLIDMDESHVVGFHHMDPTWDPSHVSRVVHNSCIIVVHQSLLK
jgi:hypothetical protein